MDKWGTYPDWVSAIATAVAAIAGIGGIWIAISTLKSLVEQTRLAKIAAAAAADGATAARKAAESTEKQLHAMITAERAHVDVEFEPFGSMGHHRIVATNLGKSIARVINVQLSHSHFEGAGEPVKYTADDTEMNHLLKPQTSIPIHEFTAQQFLTQEDREPHRRVEFSAAVEYFDIFDSNQSHVTHVFYLYDPTTHRLEYIPEATHYD